MGKKYKTRAEAMTALGDASLQESLEGPLATFVGPYWLNWQGLVTPLIGRTISRRVDDNLLCFPTCDPATRDSRIPLTLLVVHDDN